MCSVTTVCCFRLLSGFWILWCRHLTRDRVRKFTVSFWLHVRLSRIYSSWITKYHTLVSTCMGGSSVSIQPGSHLCAKLDGPLILIAFTLNFRLSVLTHIYTWYICLVDSQYSLLKFDIEAISSCLLKFYYSGAQLWAYLNILCQKLH